jgi:hypothetical protein
MFTASQRKAGGDLAWCIGMDLFAPNDVLRTKEWVETCLPE